MYWISSYGQPTRDGPLAWGLGKGLTIHCQRPACYKMLHTGSNWTASLEQVRQHIYIYERERERGRSIGVRPLTGMKGRIIIIGHHPSLHSTGLDETLPSLVLPVYFHFQAHSIHPEDGGSTVLNWYPTTALHSVRTQKHFGCIFMYINLMTFLFLHQG